MLVWGFICLLICWYIPKTGSKATEKFCLKTQKTNKQKKKKITKNVKGKQRRELIRKEREPGRWDVTWESREPAS